MIDAKIKDLVSCCPFVPIVTMASDGRPHTIIAGAVAQMAEDEDVLIFGAYKMIQTRKNLKNNDYMQVILAFRGDCPQNCKGVRLHGCGKIEDKKLFFKIMKAESIV